MIGGHWTREQKAAYRAAFSIERIGDEVWVLVAITWAVVCAVLLLYLHGAFYVVLAFAGFASLYWLTWDGLLPWLEQTMPAELRASLPRGRFKGISSPRAPRTYRELFRRWLATERPGRK